MKVDWSPLRKEFAIWRGHGLKLPYWWRDDDAVEAHPALDTLLDLADATGCNVHIAVIPDGVQASLPLALAGRWAVPVVHGRAHKNHAPEGEKKAEFGAHRPLSDLVLDAGSALHRLQQAFDKTLGPMFVPPWNRVSPDLMPELAAMGYRAISTYLPRKARWAAPGLEQINTHVDPIFWRGHRGLVDPPELVARIVRLLQDRRAGISDNTEPLGYLTHHLVHDDDIWDFSRQYLNELRDGPTTQWRLETERSNDEQTG